MKRFLKMFAVTCVAACALAVVSAAGASAAPKFTASATGTLSGTQTNNQVFKVAAAKSEAVTCTSAATSGTIAAKETAEQEVTVHYTGCTAVIPIFGTVSATVTDATYNLTANGTVHILNTITIHVSGANCNIVVGPQTPTGTVTYDNGTGANAGKIEETSAVTGIVSTSTGLCPNGTTGTYSGNNLVSRVGGGTLAWDSV
jgi:hypothetical protein